MGGYSTKESNEAFQGFDKDGDGLLKGPELEAWISSMEKLLETLAVNLGCSNEEAKAHVLAAVTVYANDGLTEEHFTAVLEPQGEHDLFRRSVFAAFRPSPDGELDAEGLKRMLDTFYKGKESGGVFAGDARLDYETGGSQRLIEVLQAHAARRRALAKLPPGTGVSYEDLAPVMAGRMSELRGLKSAGVREVETSETGPTVYHLSVEWIGGRRREVVKRYSDFHNLLAELGTNYALDDTRKNVDGVWPPRWSLETLMYGSTSLGIVEQRWKGFDEFLRFVSADPIARVHPVLCAFLSASVDPAEEETEARTTVEEEEGSTREELLRSAREGLQKIAVEEEEGSAREGLLKIMQEKGCKDTAILRELIELTTDQALLEDLYNDRMPDW